MAKKRQGLVAIPPVTIQIEPWAVEEQIERQIQQQVATAVEGCVSEAVAAAVGKVVDAISRKRVAEEIERVFEEGWPTVNSYGERTGCGKRTLRDRIGEILNAPDRYSNNGRWIDEIVKRHVDDQIKKNFDTDIKKARESFKVQVDGVLAAVVKKAVGEHLGVKV